MKNMINDKLFICDNCGNSTKGKHINIYLHIPRLFRKARHHKWGKVCIDCFMNHEPTKLELIENKSYWAVNLSGTYKRYIEIQKTKQLLNIDV
jgi:hypothetical protein